MQRLLFPFQKGMIICGYKTAQYKKAWGYPHYGIDISSIQGVEQKDHIIRASGDGKVVWCKYDTVSSGAKSLGWAIAIRYDNCLGRDGAQKNLILRYMHSSVCYVKQGDTVKAGDPIAMEGASGTSGTNNYHLHLEMDTDTVYPQYTPQVSAGHQGWKQGTDSTLNPSLWLWQSNEAQTVPYNFINRTWINEGTDTDLPWAPSDDVTALKRENDELKATLESMRVLIRQLAKL